MQPSARARQTVPFEEAGYILFGLEHPIWQEMLWSPLASAALRWEKGEVEELTVNTGAGCEVGLGQTIK